MSSVLKVHNRKEVFLKDHVAITVIAYVLQPSQRTLNMICIAVGPLHH